MLVPLDSEGVGAKALLFLDHEHRHRPTDGRASLLAAPAGATTQLAIGAGIPRRAWGQKSCDGGSRKVAPSPLKLVPPPQSDG